MRTLIEKEIRLMLPAFAGALALGILPIWFVPYEQWEAWKSPFLWPAYPFLFGAVMLALSSFGREISLNTLPFMLAQPLDRARIWWTKITVLIVFVALAFDAWWLSGSLRSILRPALWLPSKVLGVFGFCVVVFTAGGLWMTLLVRQTVAAFWLTLLIPMAIVSAIKLIGGTTWMIFVVLGLYAVAGFFLARRQFFHVQDTAWTGGVLSFGGTRTEGNQSALRVHRPWAALFWKELQLQQITLMGILGLLILHLGVVFLRKAGAEVLGKMMLSSLEMFGGVWLVVPLLAGGQSVADERQLGTLDGLLCLPVSRRKQFTVKMIFALVLGGLLSGALLCAVESFAGAIGAVAKLGSMGIYFTGYGIIFVCFTFLVLSLIGFYASTLTRGIVPALGAGAVASIVFWWIERIASNSVDFGNLWSHLLAYPILVATLIWLAFGNFRYVFESGRRWRRNIFGLIAVLVVISVSGAAIYHRVWEWAMPLEGPHGPAKLPQGKPISFGGWNNGEWLIVLPDGRLWEYLITVGQHSESVWAAKSKSHFVAGSNWLAVDEHWSEMVGIRSDGTLWVSAGPPLSLSTGRSMPFVQFGVETNWQNVLCDPVSLAILLKRDGTLWRWGDPHSFGSNGFRGLSESMPERLGVASDWVRILRGVHWIYAWERDGTAWNLHDSDLYKLGDADDKEVELSPGTAAHRMPDLDHFHFQSLITTPSFQNNEVGVRDDGTLWYWHWHGDPRQIGKDSNWAAVAGGFNQLVALKTDGSIWKWNFNLKLNFDSRNHLGAGMLLQKTPVRMGAHNDWVGLGVWMGAVATLSADGTLWRWQNSDLPEQFFSDRGQWLAPSRRPSKIQNIFDAH